MKRISKIDWARLAAYIDGEGCIAIVRGTSHKSAKSHWNLSYALRVSVANTDPRLTLWCKKLFGGFVAPWKHKNPRWHDRFNWIVSNDRAEWVLQNCLRYFVIKRQQAELGLAFRATFTEFPRKLGLPVSVVSKREAMFSRMKEMRDEIPSMSSLIQ